jgi:hypothetical protein
VNARACRDIRLDLSAYLDGDLDPVAAGETRVHLEACTACRAELEQLHLTVGALRRLPDLPAPAAILDGFRARLRPEPRHRRLLGGRQWLLGVPVGALATLLVVVGITLFQARYPGIERAVTSGGPAAAPPARVEAPTPPAASPQPREMRTVKKSDLPGQSNADAVPARRLKPVTATAPTPAGPEKPQQRGDLAAAPSRFIIPEPETAAERTVAVDEYPGGPPESIQAPPYRRFGALGSLEGQPRTVSSLRAEEPDVAAGSARVGDTGAGLRRIPIGEGRAATASRAGVESRTVGALPAAVQTTPAGTVDLGAPAEAPADLAPAAPAPAVEARRMPATSASLRVVCLLPSDGDRVDDLKRLLRREGAVDVEVAMLEPRAVREAFTPHRGRPGILHEPARGWTLRVGVAPQAVARLLDALAKRPGLRILEQPPAPAARGHLSDQQVLRITVLR